ncbi:MAG: hypothetical protein ACYS0I_16030 [Planctomycetota bacterium]|jgi:hypothetical protein
MKTHESQKFPLPDKWVSPDGYVINITKWIDRQIVEAEVEGRKIHRLNQDRTDFPGVVEWGIDGGETNREIVDTAKSLEEIVRVHFEWDF